MRGFGGRGKWPCAPGAIRVAERARGLGNLGQGFSITSEPLPRAAGGFGLFPIDDAAVLHQCNNFRGGLSQGFLSNEKTHLLLILGAMP